MLYKLYFYGEKTIELDFKPIKSNILYVEIEFEKDMFQFEWVYISKETKESIDRGAKSTDYVDFGLTRSTKTVIPLMLRGNNKTALSECYKINFNKSRTCNTHIEPLII